MIVFSWNDSARYEALHPLFGRLFAYVREHDLLHAPLGRIEVEGERLFINNVQPDCVAAEAQKLEVHRKYIDVHLLLEGEETIGWLPLSEAQQLVQPYDEGTDCALYADRASAYVSLRPGQAVAVWPEDAHAPLIGRGKVRKIIAKVAL